jgi:hypothetical protein
MGRFGSFVLGIIVGGVLVFGSQRYHVVRSKEGVQLIPKISTTFADTYVDIREFGFSDWTKHKSLAAAIIQSRQDHLMGESTADDFRDGIRSAIDRLIGDR